MNEFFAPSNRRLAGSADHQRWAEAVRAARRLPRGGFDAETTSIPISHSAREKQPVSRFLCARHGGPSRGTSAPRSRTRSPYRDVRPVLRVLESALARRVVLPLSAAFRGGVLAPRALTAASDAAQSRSVSRRIRRSLLGVSWSQPRRWSRPWASNIVSSGPRSLPAARACLRAVGMLTTTSPRSWPACWLCSPSRRANARTSVGRFFPRYVRFSFCI